MQRGLVGRRIAVAVPQGDDSRAAAVVGELKRAGALIHMLKPGEGTEEDWHGAKYAALVLVGNGSSNRGYDTRLVQLAREFLVSEKPVAALGSGGGLDVILEAGGAGGRTLAATGGGPRQSAIERAGGTGADEPIHVDGPLVTANETADVAEFASRLVREFSSRLEERDVDESSELSFPASDPPATSPVSVGQVAPDRDSDARP